jgi:hypothetical protein
LPDLEFGFFYRFYSKRLFCQAILLVASHGIKQEIEKSVKKINF